MEYIKVGDKNNMNEFVPYTSDVISAQIAGTTGGNPVGEWHVRYRKPTRVH
jgi:hypothetical protein